MDTCTGAMCFTLVCGGENSGTRWFLIFSSVCVCMTYIYIVPGYYHPGGYESGQLPKYRVGYKLLNGCENETHWEISCYGGPEDSRGLVVGDKLCVECRCDSDKCKRLWKAMKQHTSNPQHHLQPLWVSWRALLFFHSYE